MQEPKYVDVIINPDGTTSIEAVGFHGVGCKDVVSAFGDALGQAIEENEKSEFYEGQPDRNTLCNSN